MDWPLLSAIVPAYNAARFLPAAVESIRRQDYAPLEILIIDDGSTDDTPAVAAQLGTDIRYLRQQNAGPSAARNLGLRSARGEFIGFLDADDLWPAGKVSVQLARLLAQPELDAVLGRIQYLALPGRDLPDYAFEGPDNTITHVHLGSGLFRRRAFEQVGGFDESIRFCEDVDWFLRARERDLQMLILRSTTLSYRLHESNMTLQREEPDRLLAPVLKRSMDRRRATGGEARSLPRWMSYDEWSPGRPALVSAVIPAYNARRFLGDAIASVLAQSYAPVEIVVVDDGSTDGTVEVARSFGPRVRCLSQKNAGAGAARNLGVEHSTGSFLAFLDADDLWPPQKIAAQMEVLERRPECAMVFGRVRQFRDGADAGPAQPGCLPGAMLVRRRSFDQVGPFRTDLRVGEFIDWHARASELGLRPLSLDDVALLRRIHDANTGVTRRDARSDYLRVVKAALDRRR